MADLWREIKQIYAQEADLAMDDPDFWAKLNEFKTNQPEVPREIEVCPHCGQEIE